MISINEIDINKFKNNLYIAYTTLFKEDERRNWYKIKKTYEDGIEKFYEIINDDTLVGFLMIEKIKDYPSYIEYFAILKEYQGLGYGTKTLNILINEMNIDICGEIEAEGKGKSKKDNLIRSKRAKFYKELGFYKVDSQYLLYDVYYTPYVYSKKKYSKEEVDKILFEYYKANNSIEEYEKRCFKIY